MDRAWDGRANRAWIVVQRVGMALVPIQLFVTKFRTNRFQQVGRHQSFRSLFPLVGTALGDAGIYFDFLFRVALVRVQSDVGALQQYLRRFSRDVVGPARGE